MWDRVRSTKLAAVFLRLALAAGFLSAVADRFGLWGPADTPGVSWGGFAPFLAYTGKLLWFLPASLVPAAGWASTVLEVALAVGLLVGVRLRAVAVATRGPVVGVRRHDDGRPRSRAAAVVLGVVGGGRGVPAGLAPAGPGRCRCRGLLPERLAREGVMLCCLSDRLPRLAATELENANS